MVRRPSIGIVALAALLASSIPHDVAAADKKASPKLVESSGMAPSRRAALLASHGEPRLAWDELRTAGPARNDSDAALAVRLLTELDHFAQAESLLAREAAPRSGRAATWYYLQRARLSLDAGSAKRALELLSAIDAREDDPLSAYVEFVRAQAFVRAGDGAAAAAALERARGGTIPEALAGPFDDERVSVLRSLGRSADALAAVDDAITHTTDGEERRARLATRYQVAREAGDDAAATAAVLTLFDDYRMYPEAEACALEVTRPLRASGSAEGLSTRLLLACAETLAARKRPDDVRRVLRALDARDLAGIDGEHLRLLWGEYCFETGDFSRALALAKPAYSDPGYRRRSLILLARSYRAAGEKAKAAAAYEQYARDFPNDTLAPDALYAAASLREQNHQDADAARLLDEVRRAYPSSFHGWAAAMRRANELKEDGDVAEAAEIFEQWLARSRRTDEAALFYLSRLYESTSSNVDANLLIDELRRVNPYSFYVSPDIAAAARAPIRDAGGTLARSGAGSLSTWLAGTAGERERAYQRVVAATESDRDASADDIATRAALDRGRLFLDAGFRDWAERELEVVRRRPGISPDVALELARTYEQYAMPWRSLRAFDRARVGLPWETRQELAGDFRYLMYPLPYPAHVFDAAAQTEVPAHLIYAIMREESHFEFDVVSRAGAVGLMQLMPETARRVARSKELGIDVDDRLDEPAVNVAIGTWYASDLLRQGDGSVAWMLAAYNAGPGAARRWLEPGVAGDDAIVAVESIDYRETRGYVKRVVESANVYQALYFSGSSAKNAPR